MGVIFAAGGTGGHLIPALTVAKKMRSKPLFLISSKEVDSRIISKHEFPYHQLPIRSNNQLVEWIKTGIKVGSLFKEHTPKLVVGFGGFVSVLPILFGKICKARNVIFEAEIELSKSNKFLSVFSEVILTSQQINHKGKNIFVGYPVRDEFFVPLVEQNQELTIFVQGGSQAADFFDKVISRILAKNDNLGTIIHQARPENVSLVTEIYEKAGKNHKVQSFFDSPWMEYQRSHLVIIRAGAGSIYETFVSKRPFIIIPYPFSASKHQIENAKWLMNNFSAGIMLEQSSTSIDSEIFKFIQRVIDKELVEYYYNEDFAQIIKNSALKISKFLDSLVTE